MTGGRQLSDLMNYWSKRTLSRRRALRAAMLGTGGLAALSLVGCGGDDDDDGGSSSSGGGSSSSSGGGSSSGSGGGSEEPKQGGRLVHQVAGSLNNCLIATTPQANNTWVAGLVHSGLLNWDYGLADSNGIDINFLPGLAQALPENPDQLTYIFKLKDAKFHNGRKVVAEDVKYSFEQLAYGDESTRKANWNFMDKVEATDDETVVLTTKQPYAEALHSVVGASDAFIVAKEFYETAEAAKRMVGSGPYMWDDRVPDVQTTIKRNPDFYDGPAYIDEVVAIEVTDPEKQIADFTNKEVDVSFWFDEKGRDRLKEARPDAVLWDYRYAASTTVPRVDQPPFDDVRVRRALSMTTDRDKINEGVFRGAGAPDQVFSVNMGPKWGFKEPKDMGDAAQWWNYDPAEAKKLLSAANHDSPIESTYHHYDKNYTGAGIVDPITLMIANWKELGIANITDQEYTNTAASTAFAIGEYDGLCFSFGLQRQQPGNAWYAAYWSPPEGITSTPTTNLGHLNDPDLSALLEKQLTQLDFEERKATMHEAAAIMADNMYRIPWVSYSINYFATPDLRDYVIPVWYYSGHTTYMAKWWLAS
jgi:ABC-type transport system substrate-binding protein